MGRMLSRSVVAGLVLVLLGCGDSGSSSAPPVARTEPAAPVGSAGPEQPEAVYKQYCASCHGPDGKGNGPAAAALPVKPADHTNAAVMRRFPRRSSSRRSRRVGRRWGSPRPCRPGAGP